VPALKSDRDVRSAVIRALQQDDQLDSTHISVDVAAGTVTLRGTVGQQAAKIAAIRIARGVPRVLGVLDNLRVTDAGARTDAEIAASVRADLERAKVNLTPVTIDVQGGTVHLRGSVRTLEQKQLAAEIPWWTAGVRDVVDDLLVEPASQAASSA
jgi:osmotically-inducible protein OsmY